MFLAAMAFHGAVFLYYAAVNYNVAVGLLHAHERLGRPKDDPMVNRMISGCPTYFTGWNLTIQELYFSLCCIEHIAELIPKAFSPRFQDRLHRFRKMLLSIFLVPCSCTVVFIFWSIYAISPSLVFGDFLDAINPGWVNHAIHTTVAPIAILELCFRASSDGMWNGGFLRGVLVLSSFFTVYLTVISVALLFKGTWPYPLMDPLNGSTFVAFVIFSHVILWTWFSAGLYIGKKVQEKTCSRTPNAFKTK